MATIDDGGPAFPMPDERDSDGNGIKQGHPGMTLRDYFAAKAMGGIMSDMAMFQHYITRDRDTFGHVASDAYAAADAMLAARKESDAS